MQNDATIEVIVNVRLTELGESLKPRLEALRADVMASQQQSASSTASGSPNSKGIAANVMSGVNISGGAGAMHHPTQMQPQRKLHSIDEAWNLPIPAELTSRRRVSRKLCVIYLLTWYNSFAVGLAALMHSAELCCKCYTLCLQKWSQRLYGTNFSRPQSFPFLFHLWSRTEAVSNMAVNKIEFSSFHNKGKRLWLKKTRRHENIA